MKPVIKKKSVIVFAKYPEPGNVKTRIGNFLGHQFSCQIYEAMLLDLIEKLAFQNLWSCHLYIYPPDKTKVFATAFQLNADNVFPQQGSELGMRMYNAFIEQIRLGSNEIICIGSDIPAISCQHIDTAFKALSEYDSVVGPAEDGGYYLIGFRKGAVSDICFSGIQWSSCSVFYETVLKLKISGLSYSSIQTLRDLDDLSDLEFYKEILSRDECISPRLNGVINLNKKVGLSNAC